jgi:hypothetical protein
MIILDMELRHVNRVKPVGSHAIHIQRNAVSFAGYNYEHASLLLTLITTAAITLRIIRHLCAKHIIGCLILGCTQSKQSGFCERIGS